MLSVYRRWKGLGRGWEGYGRTLETESTKPSWRMSELTYAQRCGFPTTRGLTCRCWGILELSVNFRSKRCSQRYNTNTHRGELVARGRLRQREGPRLQQRPAADAGRGVDAKGVAPGLALELGGEVRVVPGCLGVWVCVL